MNRSRFTICLSALLVSTMAAGSFQTFPISAQSQAAFQTVSNVMELQEALANPDIQRIYMKDGLYALSQISADSILHIDRPVTVQGFDSNVNGTNVEISGSIVVESSQVVLDGLSFIRPVSTDLVDTEICNAILIAPSCSQVTVDHCRFSVSSPQTSTIDQGIVVSQGCHNLEIADCEFGLNLSKGVVLNPQSYDVLIRNNTISGEGNAFVSMAGVSQIRIEDNTIDHSCIEITNESPIATPVYSSDLTIGNNAFLSSYILLESERSIRQCPVRRDLELNDNYWGTPNPDPDDIVQMVGFSLLDPYKVLTLDTFYQSYFQGELTDQGSFSNFALILEAGTGGSLKAYSENMTLLPYGNYAAGETVTLAVQPEDGYVLDTLKGIYTEGSVSESISLQQTGDGNYTFVMPSASVTVSATFKDKMESDPVFAPDSGINNNYNSEGPGFTSDGSTTLTYIGQQITFTQSANGVKSAVSQSSDGKIVSAAVLVPQRAYGNSQSVSVDFGTNTLSDQPIFLDGAVVQSTFAPTISVLLQDQKAKTRLLFGLEPGSARYGTVALATEGDTAVPIVTSLADSKYLSVPVEGSASFMVRNNALSFSDLSGQEYYVQEGAIDFVSARRILTYFGGENFAPEAAVTRGMFAQILYNLAGRPAVSGQAPAGVSSSDFYYEAAIWASQNQLMGEGSAFNGETDLSREQLVTILWRYMGSPEADATLLNEYEDVDQLNTGYAIEPMAWAVENRIAGQDGRTLTPLAQAKRFQMALIIQRFITNVLVLPTGEQGTAE